MQDVELLEKLANQPGLRERVEEILNIAENADGRAQTADEAEELTIAAVRRLGQDVLGQWALKRHGETEAAYEKQPQYERGGKKNSTGTAALGRSP